ncbi:MAG: hypothetical protein IJS21_05640 [Deltaproteobacteria bacterium]|nr:hypothetical protein [Deltaproteobacteria bacterium]
MKCPKCGGEIPIYDLKPNCKHCGVNIMYFTPEAGLARDAKRTELEGAVARMFIARIKAEFIGSKLAIVRMIFSVLSAAALLVPFGGAKYSAPFFHEAFSVGILGLIKGFQNGMLTGLPSFLGSSVFGGATKAALAPAAFFVSVLVLDLLIVAALLLGFLNLTKSARLMKNAALIGAVVCVAGQIAAVVVKLTAENSPAAEVTLGFGALAAMAMFLVLFFLNRAMLKKGIEPVYRPNDIKRREMLKKVRAGEVDLDSLPLPIFESEEEHEERMKALEEALKAEEEGKEL